MLRLREALTRLWPGRAPLPAHALVDTKGSRAGPLITLETLGRPVWAPRDYGTFAREGYAQNAIVHRCVRMTAEACASIPLLLYRSGREIEEHPLVDLMRRPSPGMTGTDLLESWYGFLLVAGNAYMEAVAIDGEVRELHALRPDRMKVVPGPDGWPEAWEYEVAGRSVRFAGEVADGVRPILHLRLFNPTNDHYGLSPIEAAATAIDIHNEAARWNKALLDNSARPSGALVYAAANGQMTGEQFERLKRELEATYQGARHAGRPLLLEGGLDWKPLSLSPKDMDFIEAKHAAAREIALALGVPPMLLGIPGDNTYSNYQEASRAFWRQTVLPLVGRTTRALSEWLGGGVLEWRADLDQVEALSPEREALWARLNAASFLTEAEKRAAAGFADVESGAGMKYSPDQPRVPRGKPGGGQWTARDEGDDSGVTPVIGSGNVPQENDQLAQADDPPPLRRVHPDSTYDSDRLAKNSLEYWRKQPTDKIVESLKPGSSEPLTVKPDGTIMQGNTRAKVLQERGYDVNSLPRETLPGPQTNPPRGGRGGGGGGIGGAAFLGAHPVKCDL